MDHDRKARRDLSIGMYALREEAAVLSEYVPDPWHFILLSLAVFRVWKLIGDDTILDRPRYWLLDKMVNPDGRPFKRGGKARADYWMTFLVCPWCAGFWIAAVFWGAWLAWPTETLIVSVLFALSAAVGLIASVHDAISE